MNALTLVSGPITDNFYPFSLTRSVADIRCGIMTIREKWELLSKNNPVFSDSIKVPDNLIPPAGPLNLTFFSDLQNSPGAFAQLLIPDDILLYNGSEIKKDFNLITAGRQSQPVSATNRITGTDIFLENGAVAEHCYLNADDGPIYIGRDAQIMEGSMIRGPFAIGEKSIVKMGSKIYGATSAGPFCVLGGEIKNSVFFGYSNKAHDGYLGDSVIGEWCNLGAGSSNSNLKNSGGNIRRWNPLKKIFTEVGVKGGLMMGDFSRSAINTSFKTGAVIGVCCHVFGTGTTPVFLPSFSWGFENEVYDIENAIQHISRWKKFKNRKLSSEDVSKLKYIFDQKNK
jgi:UDP-N-acetylglucosamine diphosphorylase / glucose-1-phosphate thymidylyltransferase / UDP-N-acetylgalactosamine diphosphorylase / glucosamine-1-phosphate N-acetyltransferase / galactosamine-1-phosphate N-acetyltransferase